MAQKFGPLLPIFYILTKIAQMSLYIKFQVQLKLFQGNRQKPINWPILALFGAKKGPKI